MFVCDRCLKKKYSNLPRDFKSWGVCEVCGERDNCSDIRSELLQPKLAVKKLSFKKLKYGGKL